MDETMIDVVILLGVFFFACKWLGQAVQCFSNVKSGVAYFEAGCAFLVMSMLCASFFPIRQHAADSIANAEVREQAEEVGVTIEPGTGNETGEPGLIDSVMTCLILGLFAFGIRFAELFVKDAGSPVYYAIIVFPIAPFFLYHFFSWGFR
jgi:hypothetical protein